MQRVGLVAAGALRTVKELVMAPNREMRRRSLADGLAGGYASLWRPWSPRILRMIDLNCTNPDCGTELTVEEDRRGKKVRCPKCKKVMRVPAPAEPEPSSLEMLEPVLEARGTGLAAATEKGEELARGGMGQVMLCHDKGLGRQVAMKVMSTGIADSDEHRLRFLEEAQVTGQLEHPNIVPVHELGKDPEGNLYFTMKLVKGRSLGQIIEEVREGRSSALQSREPREGTGKSPGLQTGQAELGTDEPSVRTLATMSLSDLLNIF